MQVRVIEINDEDKSLSGDKNKCISIFNIEDNMKMDELLKTVYSIKEINKEDVGIEVNTEGVADTIGDWYNVEMISLNVPDSYKDETIPYLAVYVKSIY